MVYGQHPLLSDYSVSRETPPRRVAFARMAMPWFLSCRPLSLESSDWRRYPVSEVANSEVRARYSLQAALSTPASRRVAVRCPHGVTATFVRSERPFAVSSRTK
jgi:hypothetical protein